MTWLDAVFYYQWLFRFIQTYVFFFFVFFALGHDSRSAVCDTTEDSSPNTDVLVVQLTDAAADTRTLYYIQSPWKLYMIQLSTIEDHSKYNSYFIAIAKLHISIIPAVRNQAS